MSDFHLDLYLHLPLFPPSRFILLIHLFCQSPSSSPSFFSLSGSSAVECAPQQYLMRVWLTGCCSVQVSVFSCFVCAHVHSSEQGDRDCQQENTGTHTWTGWSTSTGNYPPGARVGRTGLFQLLTGL